MENPLERYAELLRRWAGRLDLVAPGDLERLEERHIADCLRLAPLLDELPDGPCADVGSGAGLPGVLLAIVRPERPWRLIEPRRRRAAFLEEVIRELGLTCEVVVATAADAARDPGLAGSHAAVTARAVAPSEHAMAAVLPLVAPGGAGVVFIGESGAPPAESEEWAPGIAIIRVDR
ncbi:MAG: 16S rRNA (guanine(527)-N(7))-methyltransferase RsmG [Actinomycetota bacterium]